ncbi:hypothetical protein Bphy_5001 [Paraburkholderia phymatum STM815]|uniref:Copper chaperone n=2 Tax=Paraburkholderia phymatum TaxID=148447 RepID=B2JLC3_PARP8|nr:hypothetical protein Bphy_5001 [Paraburkholderia phymatum STM815]
MKSRRKHSAKVRKVFNRYFDGRAKMKFSVKEAIHSDDISRIERAMKSVDGDAKVDVNVTTNTVSVDSWLMPEEFFVAFYDEDYNVGILEA